MFILPNHTKVLIIAFCMALLDSIVFSRGSNRRKQQESLMAGLKALFQDVKKDVPDEELSKTKKKLWKKFQVFEFAQFIHKAYILLLQENPKKHGNTGKTPTKAAAPKKVQPELRVTPLEEGDTVKVFQDLECYPDYLWPEEGTVGKVVGLLVDGDVDIEDEEKDVYTLPAECLKKVTYKWVEAEKAYELKVGDVVKSSGRGSQRLWNLEGAMHKLIGVEGIVDVVRPQWYSDVPVRVTYANGESWCYRLSNLLKRVEEVSS